MRRPAAPFASRTPRVEARPPAPRHVSTTDSVAEACAARGTVLATVSIDRPGFAGDAREAIMRWLLVVGCMSMAVLAVQCGANGPASEAPSAEDPSAVSAAAVTTPGITFPSVTVVASKTSGVCSEFFTLTGTATVAGLPLTGSLIFTPGRPYSGPPITGNGNLVNGQTSALAQFDAGATTWYAWYEPDTMAQSLWRGATGSVVVQGRQAVTSATLTSSPNPSRVGEDVTYTMTVGVDPAARISADGAQVYVAVDNLGPALALPTVSGGIATFTTNSLGLGAHALVATYRGTPCAGTIAASLTQNVVMADAPMLAFTTQPSSTLRARTIAPPVAVHVTDAGGNAVAGAPVTVALGANPGGAALSGTTTAPTDASGDAVFADLALDRAGTGYTLVASWTGAAPSTSAPFDVGALPIAFGVDCAGPCTAVTPIAVTVDGLTGNPRDWIALAPAGSALTVVDAWSYASTGIHEVATFAALPPGSYVARLMANDAYALLAESAPFAVSPNDATASLTLTCSASPCTRADTLTVTFTGMPGNRYDWIALVPAGAPTTSYTRAVFTLGAIAGTVTFTGVASGTYVARAQAGPTYTQAGADSGPLTVEGAPGATLGVACAPACASGQSLVVTFANMPGLRYDWLAAVRVGLSNDRYDRFAETGGAEDGTIDLGTLPPGTYTIQAFVGPTYTVAGSSTPFTVDGTLPTPTVSASVAGTTVTVTYGSMAGYSRDWIAVAPAGSDATTYVKYVYTEGKTSGTAVFTGLPSGTYVARAFFDNTFTIAAQSPPFAAP
jgi:hypothetical protein